MSWEVYILLLCAGAVGGFVSGLLGIGGGVIYVFVIPYALKYWQVPLEWEAQFIIANSLAAILLGSISANYTHYKKGFFFVKPIFVIGVAATISSWFSLHYFVNTSYFSMTLFLGFLLVLMTYMLVYTLKGAAKLADNGVESLPWWGMLCIGLVSGLVASASGLGGGIVVIPLLNHLFGINIKKASAISLGVITISSLTMSFANANVAVYVEGAWGLLIPTICVTLSLSVLLTAPLGVLMAHKLPSRTISYIYALLLALVMSTKVKGLFDLMFS